MTLTLYPEYQAYTRVAATLTAYVQGTPVTIDLSRTGEHLRRLTVLEGALKADDQQYVAEPLQGGAAAASGSLTVLDTDNLLYRTLLGSKSELGAQLELWIDLTLHTYTGERTYRGRIITWTITWAGGVPELELHWQQYDVAAGATVAITEPELNAAYGRLHAALTTVGISTLQDFCTVLRDSGLGVEVWTAVDNRRVRVTTEEISGVAVTVLHNQTCADEVERARFAGLEAGHGARTFLDAVFTQLCALLAPADGSTVQYQATLIDTTPAYVLYLATDPRTAVVPSDDPTAGTALRDTIFVYNSGATTARSTLPDTEGRPLTVFPVLSLQCTMSHTDVICTSADSNTAHPANGNVLLTQHGAVYYPAHTPAVLRSALTRLQSATLGQELQVTITVDNYVQFYVTGHTLVHLLIYDHLGLVHPLSGLLRISGYKYVVDGGVVRATVTLRPALTTAGHPTYSPAAFKQSYVVNGRGTAVAAGEPVDPTAPPAPAASPALATAAPYTATAPPAPPYTSSDPTPPSSTAAAGTAAAQGLQVRAHTGYPT